jgi:hypothetical protein
MTTKCANYNGPHKVISTTYKHQQKKLAQAKAAIINQEPYHQVPSYLKHQEPASTEASNSSEPPQRPAAASTATIVPRRIVTIPVNPVALGDLTKAPKHRERPPKSISSTNEEPVLPKSKPIEDIISASQSASTRSQAASQYNQLSDPEHLLQVQRTQFTTSASKAKRQQSNSTSDTQQKAHPPPIPEDKEPELPPLPPISITIDRTEVVLHSETKTSFREVNINTQSSEIGYLLAQFTKNRPKIISSSIRELSSPPGDLELNDPPYTAAASASRVKSSENKLHI